MSFDQAERHAPEGNAAQEIRRPVYGIDNPYDFAIRILAAAFLAQEAVLRKRAAQRLDKTVFAFTVGATDEILKPLVFDPQRGAIAIEGESLLANLAHQAFRDLEPPLQFYLVHSIPEFWTSQAFLNG